MAKIMNDAQYNAMMSRIFEICYELDLTTPADDPRFMEFDRLSSLAEEYENEVWRLSRSCS